MADQQQTRPKSDQPNQQPNGPPPGESGGARARRSSWSDKEALKTSNMKELRDMLGRMSKQLEHALPKFLTAERMIRVATTTVQKVPRLLECSPVTVVGAIMQAAALGLEPDNVTGSAYLVPFWNTKANRLECQLIPGYRGLMALARRSREVSAFDARVVKNGDLFDFEYGTKHYIRHKPAMGMEKRGDLWVVKGTENGQTEPETIAAYMIAYYGKATPAGAEPLSQFHVMLRPELEKAKQFTSSRTKEGEITGPWLEHPDAMRTKTVIRRGCKLLPFSIELMTAIGLEERAIAGKSQNLGALAADDLGISFSATDEDDDESGTKPDPELVTRIDQAFAALEYSEARRTTKMQEFKDRLPELLLWLEAEAIKTAKPAGEGATAAAANGAGVQAGGNGKPAAPHREPEPEPAREEITRPRRSGKFRI